MIRLPHLTVGYDLSADGSVVVEGRQSVPTRHGRFGLLWDCRNRRRQLARIPYRIRRNNLAGWTPSEARGVSDNGLTIVGTGIHNGTTEAWLATIPEPPTFALTAFASARLIGWMSTKKGDSP
jgi:hypothetical protein